MSVHHHASNEPPDCFLCGEPFPPGSIIVFWHAAGGELVLHPDCAHQLGSVLIFESGRAGMIERGQNPLSGIACRVGRNDPKVVELRRGGG